MKKVNNIPLAIDIVEKIASHGYFINEDAENHSTKLVIDILREYEQTEKVKPKRNLKEKTLNAVEVTQKIVDNLFESLKETLNQKDEEDEK